VAAPDEHGRQRAGTGRHIGRQVAAEHENPAHASPAASPARYASGALREAHHDEGAVVA
jgi:hypothetical protein